MHITQIALAKFEQTPELMGFWDRETIDGQDGTRYYRRINVEASCLACHGGKAHRPQFVKDKYPQDLAYDFKVGDLRGMYAVFVPSLPWVGLGLRSLSEIQLELNQIVPKQGIEFIHAPVTAIDPKAKQISLPEQIIDYDYAIIATGPELALDAFPGLGPETLHLADGRTLPFKFAMFLPPFRGQKFLREVTGLTDEKGMIPVLPTYRHPEFASIYAVGVATQLKPIEITPIPTGVPKVGLMSEEMALAVAHNIALELGVISGHQIKPTLQAVCFADFGDTGALFLADPLLPDAAGNRRRAITLNGFWVSWLKFAFDKYFLTKMRLGWTIPWFERWGFRAIGLPLVEPISSDVVVARSMETVN